jgi:hypothetical protein
MLTVVIVELHIQSLIGFGSISSSLRVHNITKPMTPNRVQGLQELLHHMCNNKILLVGTSRILATSIKSQNSISLYDTGKIVLLAFHIVSNFESCRKKTFTKRGLLIRVDSASADYIKSGIHTRWVVWVVLSRMDRSFEPYRFDGVEPHGFDRLSRVNLWC